jgi:uncharacterized protein (UPF0332 family)
MPFADDLLEQSRHLAKRERNRPRQASLRRAISTAYYALFHLLTTASVSNWKVVRQRPSLARAFEHRKMNSVCAKISREQSSNRAPTSGQLLKTIATTFVALQQHRHDADYDNSKKWARTEVLAQIDSVQTAFDSWNLIAGEQIAEDFPLQLLIQR